VSPPRALEPKGCDKKTVKTVFISCVCVCVCVCACRVRFCFAQANLLKKPAAAAKKDKKGKKGLKREDSFYFDAMCVCVRGRHMWVFRGKAVKTAIPLVEVVNVLV